MEPFFFSEASFLLLMSVQHDDAFRRLLPAAVRRWAVHAFMLAVPPKSSNVSEPEAVKESKLQVEKTLTARQSVRLAATGERLSNIAQQN